jgi:hypothetical protein
MGQIERKFDPNASSIMLASGKKGKSRTAEYSSLELDKEACCRCTQAQWQLILLAVCGLLLLIIVIIMISCWLTFRGDMENVRAEYYLMQQEMRSVRKTLQTEDIPKRLVQLLGDVETMTGASDKLTSLIDMATQAMQYIKANRMLEKTLELEQEMQHVVGSFLHPFETPRAPSAP